jgi:hypothetical protein
MSPSTSSSPPASTEAPPAKKSWWQAVLTSTPVVLTVVATVLAGLSSSEMTLAQYHRSLAAQNQSKASDQWGFFQAKRIRQTGMEEAFDRLPPRFKTSRGLHPGQLEAASRQLTRTLQEAEKQYAGTGKLHQATKEIARSAETTDKLLADRLARDNVRSAFAFLSDNQLPEVEDVKFEQPDINRAVQAISDRVRENELMPILHAIKDEDLYRAVETAEGNARRFESAGKSVGKILDEIDKLVREQTSRAGDFHQAVAYYRLETTQARSGPLPQPPPRSGEGVGRRGDDSLEKSDVMVQSAAEELDNLFKAARYSYTARRQKRESDYHLKTAGLYEVQVHLNSFTSDRHRTRSKLFFFGMLAAQAGVTIASLSLAVRQRNVLWALAGLAGLAAVTFSGWVYLYM